MALGLLRGEALVTKMAVLAKYVVFPVAMAAALVYSPPNYALSNNNTNRSSSSSSSK